MEQQVHSDQFFVDSRDFWWNQDFLELNSRRWQLGEVKKILDVGCGRGHWGQALAPFFHKEFHLIGIDPEIKSLQHAEGRAASQGIRSNCDYKVGSVEKLDFVDGLFDLVTCQTVLIHLPDPEIALNEMLRVLKPGGILLVAEPNNQANAIIYDSNNISLEEKIDHLKFFARCERGKKKLNLGYNSFGDQLPILFAKLNLKDIKIFLFVIASFLIPPYSSTEQQALSKDMVSAAEKELFMWSKAETQKYYYADGGAETDFEIQWKLIGQICKKRANEINNKSYFFPGGHMMYLASGRK